MRASLSSYGFLLAAIVFETIGTSFLKQSEQFTRLVPSLATCLCYVGAFYLLSLSLKTIPVGIAYAIWSGIGIVLISIIGVVAFKQHLDLAACLGLGLIIAGVAVVNLFSKSIAH
jgi:small multidrug resistance pump